ncbi:MAG: UDP-glucose 6-dehydrogenase [Candidatus Levybacteria bacterium RIFCSPHIGHO2_02_FULL_42_12]|nr:MAG: UDP-glucose 6-dehydrogenase [Candidatus Levybacteria bacterium RIFCSPHIGHO2_02_FULL_42_12]OGH42789.1 MAG: UDP-glucose 6-dehydrogenase [Candidatus Levybacteria bacterium RIFCSPLOWO2_01_FULL_42_15]
MTITFVGHGYVGLTSATVFADLGNTVWVVGHTPQKIQNLQKGILPIYEPGLEEMVKKNIKAKRLIFTLDYQEAIPLSEVVFIAVGTPPKKNGEADLSVVFEVAKEIGKHLDGYTVVATKSTVPVGTNKQIRSIIQEAISPKAVFDIASAPEFLREGCAIGDTLNPDRVVIGTESKRAEELLVKLHGLLNAKMVLTTIETAEMIKYASNAFLATKISFANAIAHLSELTGSNALKVLEGVGLDKRIGSSFLAPGAGYGGSCFPKDVKALIVIAKGYGYDFSLLKAVEAVNEHAIANIITKAKRLLKEDVSQKRIGVLGLAFKPDTDDMRDAPSIPVINALIKEGAMIASYDPVAMDNAKAILRNVKFCNDPYAVAKDSDLLIVMTEWNEFRQLDSKKIYSLMRSPNILDGRNVYDKKQMEKLGFVYQGVGR